MDTRGDALTSTRILVVDDDKVDRMIVRRALVGDGQIFHVDEAAGADELDRNLAENAYQCIFLDYNIPGSDGLSLLKKMRAGGVEAPIIMLTGQGDEQLAVELMKAGASDYLSKATLTPERLRQSMRSAMELSRARNEAQRAERELRSATERLQLAAASADVGTWDFDPQTKEAQWDARSKTIFGFSVDEEIDYPEIMQRVHEQDRARLQKAVDAALDPSGNGTFKQEYRIFLPMGEHRWVDVRGRALFEGDLNDRHAVRFIGTILDITDSKREEEALREEAEIVETLQRIGSSLTAELNLERIVQTVTDEATRMTSAQFGAFFYNVEDEKGEAYTLYTISGVPREAFSKFPMPRNTQVFDPTFKGTSILRSDDIRKDPRYGKNDPYFGMPMGHLPVVSYLAVPVKSHTGLVLGGLFFGHEAPGVFTERSERLAVGIAGWASVAMDNARLYAAEQKSRSQAEEANAAKSNFLATMSHELRTPLNAIGGYAQLVETGVYGPVQPGQLDAMRRIRRAQAHLLALINDILNFAKVEAGKIDLSVKKVSMSEMLTGIEALIEPQVLAKNIRYSYKPFKRDIVLDLDRDRTQQILLNLLTNAVKFTNRDGSITLDWTATANEVLVNVRDSGIGIDADKLPRIFDPFVQVGQFRTDTNQGIGLGLAISRELARAMGGEIRAVSKLGEGSVFTLTLPNNSASSSEPGS